tara:strand:+ start:405 stop:854 length:450 start_codon:yes stop_codon:yes gene_type:complete
MTEEVCELEVGDINVLWNRVKPGIESIHQSLPWATWIPEDIYYECKTGTAALVFEKGSDPEDAFTVLKMLTDDKSGEKTLFVWVAWCPDERVGQRIYNEVDALAASNNCSAIEYITGQPKIVERLTNLGFKKVMFHGRKELPMSIERGD